MDTQQRADHQRPDVAMVLPATSPTADCEDRADQLRAALAELPKGVTVVTTLGPSGPVGMTTSAVSSLSLAPPLILACLANRSATLEFIRGYGAFAINILAYDGAGTSDAFATRSLLDRFNEVAHCVEHGVPILDAALAWISCSLHVTYPGGDHTIVVGHVSASGCRGGDPLVRHRSAYRRLG